MVDNQANKKNPGSNGPEGLEEFIASYQSQQKSKGPSMGNDVGESFREDVSQMANLSLKEGAKDVPP